MFIHHSKNSYSNHLYKDFEVLIDHHPRLTNVAYSHIDIHRQTDLLPRLPKAGKSLFRSNLLWAQTTLHHKASLMLTYLNIHFATKALFMSSGLRIPRPPYLIGVVIVSQFTRYTFFLTFEPPHRRRLKNPCNFLLNPFGKIFITIGSPYAPSDPKI